MPGRRLWVVYGRSNIALSCERILRVVPEGLHPPALVSLNALFGGLSPLLGRGPRPMMPMQDHSSGRLPFSDGPSGFRSHARGIAKVEV
jgi:hypothetical protein